MTQPAGMVLPYGLINFEIRDLRPSGVATVLIYPGPCTALLAHSWARYGKIPNGTTTWYDFSHDEFTGTGAQTVSVSTPDEALSLTEVDGARGDDDGQRNGVIRDPGGPASLAHTAPSGGVPRFRAAGRQLRAAGHPLPDGATLDTAGDGDRRSGADRN